MGNGDLASEQAEPAGPPRSRTWSWFSATISPTVALVVFGLGLLCGIPLAIFGFDMLMENAAVVFAALLGLFGFVVIVTVLILAFRRSIWDRLFRFGSVEMDRFAKPLADVARFAAEQNVAEATRSAQDLAEMVLARYSWMATRRWLVATVTAFIAAIAALAGSALLFQQNQLLRVQNERVTEQTELLRNQIELGEAQRSTSIVPEILAIGDLLGEETARLTKSGGAGHYGDADLSVGLRTRIVAATNAARPYRYLRSPLAYADELTINAELIARREDLASLRAGVAESLLRFEALYGARQQAGELTDRPVSPERGQIIALLYGTRVLETGYLNFAGADFSFAEVRLPLLANMSFRHGTFRFADFSSINLHTVDFGGAYLEGARFRFAVIESVSFSGVPAAETRPPYRADPGIAFWITSMAGVDFSGAVLARSRFANVNGLAMNFDGAVLDDVSFRDASIGASTFRQAILEAVDFTGANLASVDFSGAYVFEPDFLARLSREAVPESFVADRFALEQIEPGDLAAHPQYMHTWRFETQMEGPVYRVIRVGEFA